MPDPREGGDTRGIVLISLLLGRDFILFDIKEAPRVGHFDILVTSLLSFSQARPTSWRVSGKSQGEFMNNITLFAAFLNKILLTFVFLGHNLID
jgi:hypothetical protein